jgi:hypothetical protein
VVTALIFGVPITLAVLIAAFLLYRARFHRPLWIVRKTGEPNDEADDVERWLHPGRYQRSFTTSRHL